jgi:hypothetical protein
MNGADMKRRSILIPVYNVEEYVAGAIRSALGQTHPQRKSWSSTMVSTEPLAHLRRRAESLSADPIDRTRDDIVVIEKTFAPPEALSIPCLAPYIGRKAREAASVRDRAASRRLWVMLARQPGRPWPRRARALITAVASGLAAWVAFGREQARLTGGSAD